MNRRHFIIEAGKAFPVIAGAAYFIGCDSNDSAMNDDDDNTPSPNVLNVRSTTDSGHSHTTQIPLSDLNAPSTRTYDTSNDGGHRHMVTLSATQLEAINNGGSVTETSTSDAGHTHQFTFELMQVNDPELPGSEY